MKPIGILFSLIILTSTSLFGQQFLWSTVENTATKKVSTENVTREVLEFYDFYKYYHDGAGYSKSNFLNAIDKYGDKSENWINFKQSILKIDTLSVFAIRSNNGAGSVVLVICVTKENINFVAFSNNPEIGSQRTVPMEDEKRKFIKWFESLLK